MARILTSVYTGRYPLGGCLSWNLQWIVGLHRLGHDVHVLEKGDYRDAWFDPATGRLCDDAAPGYALLDRVLRRFGLVGRYTAVDVHNQWYGRTQAEARELFQSADLLLDLGNHGAWIPEADAAGVTTARVDGEPGMTQIKMLKAQSAAAPLPAFHHYYSNGANIGTPRTTAPTAGVAWRPIFNPVLTELFEARPPSPDAPFTTVMNWQSHKPVVFEGRAWGQKDAEFPKFLDLPGRVAGPMEIAVAGAAPQDLLRAHGWRITDAHQASRTLGAFRRYLRNSAGEFGVAKQMFVEPRTGWFSDRSAAYLAAGRPVILQETGFSDHLPTGRGLFAVETVEEAAEAVMMIRGDMERQSRWAREIACEHLEARKVLAAFLEELGLEGAKRAQANFEAPNI
jgi:hypothetical protein